MVVAECSNLYFEFYACLKISKCHHSKVSERNRALSSALECWQQ